jgi:hypothetical protein
MNKSNGIVAISCAGEERLRRLERPMEEVVVEVRLRALVNGSQLRTTASAIAVNLARTIATQSLTAFFL